MKRQARKTSPVKRTQSVSRVSSKTTTSTLKAFSTPLTTVARSSSVARPVGFSSTRVATSTTNKKRPSQSTAGKRSLVSGSFGTKHALPALPYADNALEPYITARTLSFHHGKHHQTYVTNLNNLVADTPYVDQTLGEIIVNSHKNKDTPVFNNAAQHFNHDFFWKSMKPGGGGVPSNELGKAIEDEFGSFQAFRDEFKKAAATHFGSGWAFLAACKKTKKLKVMGCHDADTPLVHDHIPIITTDVWEHSYYLDYQNRRPDYVEDFLTHLANWDFANDNYTKSQV